jgi:uncharacterized UPF0160 family protein
MKNITQSDNVDLKLVSKLEDKLYELFVREIDANDNGIEIVEIKLFVNTFNLKSI